MRWTYIHLDQDRYLSTRVLEYHGTTYIHMARVFRKMIFLFTLGYGHTTGEDVAMTFYKQENSEKACFGPLLEGER